MDLQKVEDKVLPRSRKPPTSKIEGGERLKMETLGSEFFFFFFFFVLTLFLCRGNNQ